MDCYADPCVLNNGFLFGYEDTLTGAFVLLLMPGLVVLTRKGTRGPLFLYLSVSHSCVFRWQKPGPSLSEKSLLAFKGMISALCPCHN